MAPGMMERKIHATGNFQNCTKNTVRSGLDGRKVVCSTSICLSSVASCPIWGIPMKRMMEIAAAYSLRLIRMYRWKRGFQELAVERTTAKRKVPTAPMAEYRKEAKEIAYDSVGVLGLLCGNR
jgi:hypothetical protein